MILILGFVVGVLYASAKMRFVEDVLPNKRYALSSPAGASLSRAPAALAAPRRSRAATRVLVSVEPPDHFRSPTRPPPSSVSVALLNSARPRLADPFTFGRSTWWSPRSRSSRALPPQPPSRRASSTARRSASSRRLVLRGWCRRLVHHRALRRAAHRREDLPPRRRKPRGLRSAVSAYKFAALDPAVMRDGAQIVLLARPVPALAVRRDVLRVSGSPPPRGRWRRRGGHPAASTLYVYLGDTGRRGGLGDRRGPRSWRWRSTPSGSP